MGSKGRLFLGLGISLFLLWWIFRGTNWGEMWAAIQQADYRLLAAACVVNVLGVVVRIFRWRALFWPNNRGLSNLALFDALNLGYLANNLLPARAGDLLRAYFVSEWTSVSVAQALATTVVERVLDLLLIVLMLFALVPFLDMPQELRDAGTIFGVIVVGVGAVMVVLSFQRELSRRLLRQALGLMPKVDAERWADRIIEVLDGFAILRAPGPLLRVGGWSLLVWLEAIIVYVLTFWAFGQSQLGIVAAGLTIVGAALGMALPGAPSAVGTFHAGATAALLALNVEPGMAAALAVTLHAINFLTLTVMGFWSLARRGLNYADLNRQASRATTQEQASRL